MTQERLKILEMLAEGKITADQATQLLSALAEEAEAEESEAEYGAEEAFETLDEPQGQRIEFTEDDSIPDPVTGEALPAQAVLGSSSPAPAKLGSSSTASSSASGSAAGSVAASGMSPSPNFKKFRSWWTIPLAVGATLALLSGWWLFLGTLREWNGFWLACLWLPLLLGVFLATLGWLSRTAKWLHVRVDTGEDEWPRHIAISFPIPVRLTAWALRTFGHFIPDEGGRFNSQQLEMIFESMTNALTPEEPLYVEVNEGQGKEKVQVYIG